MKGVIILPKYLERLWTPKTKDTNFDNIVSENVHLYYTMRDVFGFEIRYDNKVSVASDVDVVCVFAVPYHNRPALIPGLLDLNKNIKLVTFTGDLQCYSNKLCLDNKIKVFNRSDLIISFSNEYFMKMYPQFLSKYRFLPKSFAPHSRYTSLLFNDKPKLKGLFCGSVNKSVYPLRSLIVNKHYADIDYKRPKYTGADYAKLLHSYFCGITCSSIFNYALAKCFEIPATGSLLLTNETVDLKKLGFIPHQHYIPITKENVFSKVTQCIKNPADYDNIRKEGMKFVRENHSIVNRVDLLKKFFSDLME